jgi:hypothetical protein
MQFKLSIPLHFSNETAIAEAIKVLMAWSLTQQGQRVYGWQITKPNEVTLFISLPQEEENTRPAVATLILQLSQVPEISFINTTFD